MFIQVDGRIGHLFIENTLFFHWYLLNNRGICLVLAWLGVISIHLYRLLFCTINLFVSHNENKLTSVLDHKNMHIIYSNTHGNVDDRQSHYLSDIWKFWMEILWIKIKDRTKLIKFEIYFCSVLFLQCHSYYFIKFLDAKTSLASVVSFQTGRSKVWLTFVNLKDFLFCK